MKRGLLGQSEVDTSSLASTSPRADEPRPAKKARRAEDENDGSPQGPALSAVEGKEEAEGGDVGRLKGENNRKREGGCLVAEGYEEVLTFLGTLINEYKQTHVKFPSAVLIGSRAAYHWDDSFRTPDDWNLVILPWALENWLAINYLNVVKPESGLKLYEYVLPNPRLPEAALPKRTPGHGPTPYKMWRVDCMMDTQMIHFDLCAKYLYDQAVQMQPSSNCLLFDIVSNFVISHKERVSAVKQFPGGGKAMVAPLEVLEAIKRSHICWPSGSWHKHIHDLHALRLKLEEKNGVKFNESQRSADIEEFHQRRFRETEERLGIPGMHLNFDTSWGPNPSHQHKALHRVVAHDSELPFYAALERIHVLTVDVFVSLRHESKLKLLREEVMTLALERRLASPSTISTERAYTDTLERFCTVLTRGILRDFALDHYPELEQGAAGFAALCEGNLPQTGDARGTADEGSAEQDEPCPVLNLPDRPQPDRQVLRSAPSSIGGPL